MAGSLMHWWHFLGRLLCRFVAWCHTFAEIAACWCWITQPHCSGKKSHWLLAHTLLKMCVVNSLLALPDWRRMLPGKADSQSKMQFPEICYRNTPPNPKPGKTVGAERQDLPHQVSVGPQRDCWPSKPVILYRQWHCAFPQMTDVWVGWDGSMR